jgi:regulator of cell morphogenesis and NO signaling
MQLSEVVEEHPSLIPVICRFGISMGIGDESVQTICRKHSLDTEFFLTIINTFLNEDYFPEKKLQGFHVTLLVDYLTKTNNYYRRHQLPNIERHLRSFIAASTPGNNSLILIGRIFESFKEELLTRIRKDETQWFPCCLALSGKSEESHAAPPAAPAPDDDPAEAMLTDLKHIMVKHLSGAYDENLYFAVIFAVYTLGRDIKQHNRIRYRILLPMVAAMETHRP